MKRRLALAVALSVIAVIGWLDYVTGPDVGFSLIYLMAIAGMAWVFGGVEAIVCAVAAAVAWFIADSLWRPSSLLTVSAWNAFTRLVIYTSVAYLVRRVRIDRTAMMSLNVQLQDALRREASLARTDQLTQLPNSRAFLEYLNRENARAARERSSVCVLYLDLDHFKQINDIYGHAAGDAVLRKSAEAIVSAVRDGDVVARIGGDEFAVLLWHVSMDEASLVIDRISRRIELIAAEYDRAGFGISIGMGFFDEPPADPDEVVRAADRAMYRAKEARRQTGM